ncbi:hypothetical protein HO133_007186 [Letharia lupina]|uniref:Uncharacterized protein n=1 Tax=Letharia lupina TaxID=560253 RepID=A0A8H6FID8_9LECA|nr:uncharacterized protein HO133_007186 [Letharia lupina]KAF6229072.1 hypothetical protein HO133_007186 [Letharia lupina]
MAIISPILSGDRGFGGNGNASDTKSVAYGHCVTDGPFANLKVLYYGRESQPHCLSRGFDVRESTAQNTAKKLQPEVLENVLNATNYATFSYRLELDAHDAIPLTIRGDFYRVTAPNGYGGSGNKETPQIRYTSDSTAITDETIYSHVTKSLDLGYLAPSIQISKVIRTETELLCYNY